MRRLIVIVLLLLSGCIQIGDKPHPQNYYLLHAGLAPVDTETPSPKILAINIEAIDLAPFLDTQNITFRHSDNLINYRQSERWAEPLGSNITRVIRTNLLKIFPNATITTGPWEKRSAGALAIRLSIDDFSSHSASATGMSAVYQIRYRGQSYNQNYQHTINTGTSVPAQVKGLNQILDNFCRVLAEDIMKLPL